jgi:DNA segregation ATPase FtsK/SpoIIIE, S-DNA-T family
LGGFIIFELLIPATVGAAVMLFGRKKKMTDKACIDLVFRDMGLHHKREKEAVYPILVDADKGDSKTTYIYNTVVGLPDKALKALDELLARTLDKEVKVEYKKFLRITVYEEKMPAKVFYHEVPQRKGWVVPLGKNVEGWHFHDFDKTPHMTIAGTTRFGKTVNLKSITTYLIENHPENVEFVYLDLKGGLEFHRYRNLKQVRHVCKDAVEAFAVLQDLHKDITNRMDYFLEKGWSNIVDSPIQKRLFIIVDEAAQLAAEKWMTKEMKSMLVSCQWYLSEIARVAGGLGVRLIYATQYPTADTLPRQIKQNSDIKVSYRLPSDYASKVAIDVYGAETLPSDIKGRALIKTHELKEVQTPMITDKEMLRRVKKYAINKTDVKKEKRADDTIEIG